MTRRSAIASLASFIFCGCEFGSSKEYSLSLSNSTQTIYKFGIHPYLNPQDMHRVYQPLMSYLETKIKNVKFILESSRDYRQFEEKLYARKFELALPNPYQTWLSFGSGYNVIAKMAPDSDFRGIIVVRKDSNIRNISQLGGGVISFPAPTALAATMMPLLYLHEHGIDVKKEIKMRFVGSQKSSILNAYSKHTIAGATWPPPWRAWCQNNPVEAEQMEVLVQTAHLINNSIVARDDIPNSIVSEIANALFELKSVKAGASIMKNGSFLGFDSSNNNEYIVVNEFMKKFEKEIGEPKIIASLGV